MATTTDRRSLLKVLAAGSAAAATGAAPAAAAQKIEPLPEAMGMAVRHDRLHRLQDLCRRLPRSQRPRARHRRRGPLAVAGGPERRTKNIIKLYQGGRPALVHEGAVHALRRSGLRRRLHAARLPQERGHRRRRVGSVLLRRLPLLPDGLPVQRAEVRVRQGAPEIVKCELCRHRVEGAALTEQDGFTRYPKGHGPACCEVCPREAVIYGKREELLLEAKRRIAEEPGSTSKIASTASSRAAARRCSTFRMRRSDKLGLPKLGKKAFRGPPTRSRKGSTRASSRRSRPTPCSPA